MKWKKLGRLFDPTEHRLTGNCVDYAKSPQAVVFDNYIRVYFSAVERDRSGKYRSQVHYVDFDRHLRTITGLSSEPVIPLGGLGSFDEHGIFPFNVLRYKDAILAYTTGWNRRVSVSVDAAIGLAVSHDGGSTFRKFGEGPVLAPSLNEPCLVGDAFVAGFKGVFHMWYIYGSRWIEDPAEGAPQRVYKIVYARSHDGISWEKEGRHLISDKLGNNECQALPTVIEHDDRYHMFFCYRQATDFRKNRSRGYRIGYAYSGDLKHWRRDDDNAGIDVSDRGWDADMLCYPNVFECDGKIYMLYNGNEFGRYGFGAAILESL
jgi:predicted GH43/DUF377 family glycosyl hydrolase